MNINYNDVIQSKHLALRKARSLQFFNIMRTLLILIYFGYGYLTEFDHELYRSEAIFLGLILLVIYSLFTFIRIRYLKFKYKT